MDVDGMGLGDGVDDEPILDSPYFGVLASSQLEDGVEVDGEGSLDRPGEEGSHAGLDYWWIGDGL